MSGVEVKAATSLNGDRDQRRAREAPGATRRDTPRAVHLADLLRGDQDLIILNGERRYRLHRTRVGKLILTKDEEPSSPTAERGDSDV